MYQYKNRFIKPSRLEKIFASPCSRSSCDHAISEYWFAAYHSATWTAAASLHGHAKVSSLKIHVLYHRFVSTDIENLHPRSLTGTSPLSVKKRESLPNFYYAAEKLTSGTSVLRLKIPSLQCSVFGSDAYFSRTRCGRKGKRLFKVGGSPG